MPDFETTMQIMLFVIAFGGMYLGFLKDSL